MEVKVYAMGRGARGAGERGGRWGESRRDDGLFIPRATGPFYTASPHPVTDATRLLNASCDRRVGGYFVLALNNHHRRLFISPRIHRSSTSAFRPLSDEWGIVMIPHLTYLGCVALVYEC